MKFAGIYLGSPRTDQFDLVAILRSKNAMEVYPFKTLFRETAQKRGEEVSITEREKEGRRRRAEAIARRKAEHPNDPHLHDPDEEEVSDLKLEKMKAMFALTEAKRGAYYVKRYIEQGVLPGPLDLHLYETEATLEGSDPELERPLSEEEFAYLLAAGVRVAPEANMPGVYHWIEKDVTLPIDITRYEFWGTADSPGDLYRNIYHNLVNRSLEDAKQAAGKHGKFERLKATNDRLRRYGITRRAFEQLARDTLPDHRSLKGVLFASQQMKFMPEPSPRPGRLETFAAGWTASFSKAAYLMGLRF